MPFRHLIIAVFMFGCSDIDAVTVEENFGTARPVCDVGETEVFHSTSNPKYVEISTTAGDPLYFAPVYADPINVSITISDAFSADQQEAAIRATDTIREMTSGLLNINPTVGPTTCGQDYAIHADYAWNCSLKESATSYRYGWYFGKPYRIVVRHTTEVLKSPSASTIYLVALHEIGHAIGLDHGPGFMNARVGADKAEFTSKQADYIAKRFHWDKDKMIPGVYDY